MTEFICDLYRQCASAALNDVRQYLTEEGGQVAVGQMLNAVVGQSFECWSDTVHDAKMRLHSSSVFVLCRFLMQQTPPEKGGKPSSSLQSRMALR